MANPYAITGLTLRKFRTTCLKMTQEALASLIGIDRVTLVRWEALGVKPLPRSGQAGLVLVATDSDKYKELMELQMATYKNYLDKQKLGQRFDDISAYLPRFNKDAENRNEADRFALVKVPKRARADGITANRARSLIWLASDYVNMERLVPDEQLEKIVQGALAQHLASGFQQGAVVPGKDNLFAVFLNPSQSLMVLVVSADAYGTQVFELFIEENWDTYNNISQLLPIAEQDGSDETAAGE